MIWHFYWMWLAIASGVTFLVYGFNKALSKMGGRRVPEVALHGLALLGGFPGERRLMSVMFLSYS
jgi:uncharacterized membrane protein YsdA (DUF1294 family)